MPELPEVETVRSGLEKHVVGRTITDVEVLEHDGDRVQVRFNWFTLYFRYNTVDTYFGTSFYTLDTRGVQPLITRKKVVLKNDYIHHVVDVYHF